MTITQKDHILTPFSIGLPRPLHPCISTKKGKVAPAFLVSYRVTSAITEVNVIFCTRIILAFKNFVNTFAQGNRKKPVFLSLGLNKYLKKSHNSYVVIF